MSARPSRSYQGGSDYEKLERITLLFLDTDRLEKGYGLKATTREKGSRDADVDALNRNSMNILRISYKHFWVRNAASSGKHSLISKTKWAIHNKGKFEDLQVCSKDFVDRLHDVVPIRKESQDQII